MSLLFLAIGLISGILCSYFLSSEFYLLSVSYFVLIGTTLFIYFYAKTKNAVSLQQKSYLLIFILLFALFGSLKFHLIQTHTTTIESLHNKSVQGIVFKRNISDAGYQTLHLSLENAYSETSKTPINGYLIVTIDTMGTRFELGDNLLLKATLTAFENDPNPGSFDAPFYYQMHHYLGRAFVPSISVTKIGEKENWFIFFAKWQEHLSNQISSLLPSSVSGLAVALLVGAKGDIDQEVIESFQNTGAMHVLAVSGLHVGLILVAIQKLLSLFARWISRKTAITISIAFIIMFGLISGASPAVVRAVIMFVIIAFGQLLNRKGNGLNSLFLSAIILLLYDPFYLFDVGFQLSYAAMLGIFLFQPSISQLFEPKHPVTSWIWEGSAIGIAATIATAPFILFWFHQFPNYFLLSNLVVMIFGSVVLYILIALLIGSWIPFLNILLIFGSIVSIQLLIWGIQWVNEIPGGVSAGFEISEAQFVLLLIGTCVLSYFFFIQKKINASISVLGLILIGILSFQRIEKFNQNELVIFASNQFCGSIQYNGKLIMFSEGSEKPDQNTRILNAAVRYSGLNETKRLSLKTINKLNVENTSCSIIQNKSGWKIQIGDTSFHYRNRGIPKQSEPQALMTKRIQKALNNEHLEYFRLPL